ncbi:sterol desaturase family protein [Methylocaldum sp.]|uniref:sterol desaturase family protein n=1 Tax=Methylocaldum sp. TaxID=1969727 RepID=UPI002D2D9665|nr:sterol desaturase family protein [Methylocaldum sp.]HYE35073.1 sterol desaturase family protein [Methylocaldum sp.]
MTEPFIRLVFFLGTLGLMLLWEWRRPFRKFPEGKTRRLARHLGLMILNSGIARILSGGGAYFAAAFAFERHWGLLNQFALPYGLSFVLALILLDFAIYLQHVAFHRVPLFWRLHKIHHLDLGFDTTTAIRFHPLEIVLSTYYKMALAIGFGLLPQAVLVFEILLNACALFNHGNARLPGSWERTIRLFLITPDMHRIHHSSYRLETDSNFGFSVPFWDKLCGTYCKRPHLGHEGMEIGLKEQRDPKLLDFWRLLVLPFR